MIKKNLKIWLIAITVVLVWYFCIFEDGIRFQLFMQGLKELIGDIMHDSNQNTKTIFGF